jgi:uncharacterized membrane protein YciS (DUF1049 family)
MANKLDMNQVLRYLLMAVGALAVPVIIAMIPAINGFITNNLAMLTQVQFQGITLLGVLEAALGIGIADKLLG